MKTILSWYTIYANMLLQEGQTGLIILPPDEYDAVAVARMIAYVYQGTYDDVKELPPHEPQSWEDPSWEVDIAGDDYIPSRMVANAAVHALADFFDMPDLQAFAKARFRTLTLDFWRPALSHIPTVIYAVFGTQGNDHPDLQGPVLERCVIIYKNIITNTKCIEAMDIYPAFSRGLLQVVGKHLEDETTVRTNQNKQLTKDIDVLKSTAENHEYETSVTHSDLRLIHKKLNKILTKRQHSAFTSMGGRRKVDEAGNTAFKEEIKSIIQILLPYTEVETQEWVEENPDRPPEWGSGDGWNE